MQHQANSLLSRIPYRPELRGHVGVEREFFLLEPSDGAQPRFAARSPDFLAAINDAAWTYELSACQAEHRTEPFADLADIRDALASGLARGQRAAESVGLRLSAVEVAPADMPLTVYPHDARYASIAASIPAHVLAAACRVAGTHFHVGCASAEEALAVHNALVPHLTALADLGDHSNGERLRLYKAMATNWQPPVYASAEHFETVAAEQGFAENLRNCWHLIRVSRHGTVELRLFGMTADPNETISWIQAVRDILRSV